jgi:hypothetical protein
MKHILPDNGGRRSGIERRQFSLAGIFPNVGLVRIGEAVTIEDENQEQQTNINTLKGRIHK